MGGMNTIRRQVVLCEKARGYIHKLISYTLENAANVDAITIRSLAAVQKVTRLKGKRQPQ